MYKRYIIFLIILHATIVKAQSSIEVSSDPVQDSIKTKEFVKQLGNGFLTTKYFNFDLRYLIKYNQYEGIRTGIGGITTMPFLKNFELTVMAFMVLEIVGINIA
ncbi:hypothetical protein ACFQ0I_04925 [Mariniflexile aquimaris]|uniref:Uncharacterized protein n=1 Tax=Mariniflexile aquimaris TaxID=881009 RepID=A0ABW3BPP3_9FLAO